jgi:hypothetical protein
VKAVVQLKHEIKILLRNSLFYHELAFLQLPDLLIGDVLTSKAGAGPLQNDLHIINI